MIADSECSYGCPIGSLALELHQADPAARALLAANFTAWVGAIERCLAEAADRLPAGLDRRALGEFVLAAMEGGVMQARTRRDVAAFDRSIAALRDHFDMLLEKAARETA